MKKYNNQNGFTLIEILFATAILAIGMLGVASMQTSAMKGNDTSIRLTTAATWGGDALETLMARPYTHVDLIDVNNDGIAGLGFTNVAGNLSDGGPVVRGDFTVFWNVADNYPVFATKTIRVLVQRRDKGTIKTVTMDFTKMEPI